MKVKSESEVAQLCLTLSDPMDWSPPGSSIHGIFRARVLEWGAVTFPVPPLRELVIAFYVCIDLNLGEGNGIPLQYSCLENPMDGGAWWALVHGVAKSCT